MDKVFDANINPVSYVHYGFSELLAMTFALIVLALLVGYIQKRVGW